MVDGILLIWSSTLLQSAQSLDNRKKYLNPYLGQSTHFQVGGDNPKVEGHEFFQSSPRVQ